MPVCEFDTKISNGLIRIPKPYEKKILSSVKVILLYDEPPKKHKTLKQRLAEYYGENYDPSKIREELQEVDWGKPVGEEEKMLLT